MRFLTVALFLAVTGFPANAASGYVTPPAPHDPMQAKCEIMRVVSAIDARDASKLGEIKIVSDAAGEVEGAEYQLFFDEFAAEEKPEAEKQNREKPIQIIGLGYLRTSPVHVIYAVRVGRGNGMGRTWTFAFYSNHVVIIRSADEFTPLADNEVFGPEKECLKAEANG